jgi:hypothetical protein
VAEKINGWTISQRGGMWQAVTPDGIVGKTHEVKAYVEAFARTTDATKFGKR